MSEHCPGRPLLIQADFDGELPVAEAAALEAHVRNCPVCAAIRRDLQGLSARLRAEVPRHPAPAALRRRVTPPRWRPPLTFGAGAALGAAMLGMAWVLLPAADSGLDAALVAGHVRALQPGHLTDVVSEDRHTVKPWFDGRIAFAPDVRDFAAQGFPLLGGRLDALPGVAGPVAALAYRHGGHPIDVFVWPEAGPDRAAAVTQAGGFSIARWSRGGLRYAAVSSMDREEMTVFARLWAAP